MVTRKKNKGKAKTAQGNAIPLPASTPDKTVSEITIKTLHATYGPHAVAILREHLQELPRERKRGAIRKYKILNPLLSVEEFLELRKKRFTTTADALVDDAFSAFEELASELQECYDNLPEQFQHGDKGSQIEQARDDLDNVSRLDLPECVADLELFYLPAEKIVSRPDRRDDAVRRLQAVVEAINDLIDANPDSDDVGEMQDCISLIEDAIGEAENVEFPTMYG